MRTENANRPLPSVRNKFDVMENLGSVSVLLTQRCSVDTIEKNEMGGTCSAYEVEEMRIQGFGGDTLGIETTLETQA